MFQQSIRALSSLLLVFPMMAQAQVQRPPQFVNLAFDGSKNADMWEATRSFARQEGIKFTYFISGVYFVSDSDRNLYREPARGTGRSAIGFGKSEAEVAERVNHVLAAMFEGHEIASHANGHYDGSGYNYNQWLSELTQFDDILLTAYDRYKVGGYGQNWRSFIGHKVTGFRAPLLGHNKNMFVALNNTGYSYDTSKITSMDYWPKKSDGIWNFPLAGLRLAYSGKATASMDYNLYVGQSKGVAAPGDQLRRLEDEVVDTYLRYFKSNYFGNRAPIDIGHHFSLWNGGIYWNAMKRFAKTVCHLPEVHCGTYQDQVAFLESKSSSEIAQYQAGNFQKMSPSQINMPASLQNASLADWAPLTEKEINELNSCTPEAHADDNGISFIEI